MVIDLESPAADGPPPLQDAAKPDAKQVAPFANMGVDAPSAASPQLAVKARPETKSPQPGANLAIQTPKAPVKTPSPALKVASPAMKVAHPVMKVAPPAMKVAPLAMKNASPIVKAASLANVPQKPAAKATPPPAPAPTPTPPVSSAAAPEPPAPAAAIDDSLESLFGLAGTPTSSTQAANPELNFTDMPFSLAAGDEESQPQNEPRDEEFDLSAFTVDPSDDLLSADDASMTGGTGRAGVAPMDLSVLPVAPEDVSKQPERAPEANMDDFFSLSGTSMDMDLGLTGRADDTTTNFDELFFDGGDTEMADVDDAYFTL